MYREVKRSSNLEPHGVWLPLAPSIVEGGRMGLVQKVIQPTLGKVEDALLWENFRTLLGIANSVRDPGPISQGLTV